MEHLESNVSLAAVINQGDWNPDPDNQDRSLAQTKIWEMMEDPRRFIWFTNPEATVELSKLKFFFS